MQVRKIIEFLTTTTDPSFSMAFTAGMHSISTATVLQHMMRYATWYYTDLLADPSTDETETQIMTRFMMQWAAYRDDTSGNLGKAYAAMDATYDPLSNYDMVEQAADGRRVAKKTQESTPTGSTTVAITHTGSETTTDTTYQAGVDSTGDGVQTDKQVTKRDPSALSDTQTTSYAAGTKTTVTDQSQNDQSASADGYTLTGLDQATEHVLTRKGNIGVTTSQQMAMSELELRQAQMLRDYISRFIRQTCYGLGVYPS